MSVLLATRGMISCCGKKEKLLSCESPDIQTVIEVRPRIRNTKGPSISAIQPPKVQVYELKPTLKKLEGPELVPPPDKPIPTGSGNLRPIIKKVEKE